jgi:putative spermidine/putrescine transport system ATP-binding protein
MAKVSIRALGKQFGSAVAVSDFSLDIDDGELITLLGPSGCGKTTTLRMVAGFVEPTAGSILVGDRDITRLPAHRRNTGMVFQRYALFPHMTVAENVAFGLEMHKVPAGEREARIRAALDMVRMTQLRDRYPRQLSGGQQQRIAVARALAIQPDVFLLDEPLSNLDAKLRVEVREEIRSLQRRLGLTTIFVTHDQEEALAMSDRMAVMHDGKVQQVGTPESLYESPANLFVADFLGKMNFFPGRLEATNRFLTDKGQSLVVDRSITSGTRVGVRPERISLLAQPAAGNALAGVVESAVYLGFQIDARVRLRTGELLSCQVPNGPAAAAAPVAVGSEVYACFRPADCVIFSE